MNMKRFVYVACAGAAYFLFILTGVTYNKLSTVAESLITTQEYVEYLLNEVDDLRQWQADHIERDAERDSTAPSSSQQENIQPAYENHSQDVSEELTEEYISISARLTAYCPCDECSGGWGTQTATQTTATEGRTIAVDPSIIPLGSRVEIPGYGTFVAEDVGGAVKGNTIDVFFDSHDKVTDWENPTVEVRVYAE